MNRTIVKPPIRLLFCALALALATTSCEKYLDNGTPPNQLTEEKAFVDSATATSVVLALYSRVSNTNPQNNSLAFNITRLGAMSADVGYYLTNSSFDDFKNNTLGAGNAANPLWYDLYGNIGRANFALKGLGATATLTPTVKAQLEGEAKFWRAWCYFYLVQFFGDVPLVTSTDALTTSLLPRAPVAQVYQQMVKDLAEAKSLLKPAYLTVDKARVNKWAAAALLARVHFYQKNWAAAEAEATEVIGSGVYSLETSLANVFTKSSKETILQIANTTGVTSMGAEFIPASTTPNFVLFDTLARTFEAGDKRKAEWTKSITYSGKTYDYPYKYKQRSGTAGNEYPVVLRLAELYLIRAEARAHQDKLPGALDDIGVVRERAGLLPLPSVTGKADLLKALEHERWVELFTEWGDRWFNLKRSGSADAVLSKIKPQWKPHQKLYPIPDQELIANPNLTPNEGY